MQPRPVLCDMPDHIKQRIVDSLDTVTKRTVRRCSVEFKTFSDSSSIHYHQLILHIKSQCIAIRVTIDRLDPSNKLEIEFSSRPRGHLIQNENEHFEKVVVGWKDYLEAAAEHFLKIWKNPKVTVSNFYLSMTSDPPNGFYDFLVHLNRLKEGSCTLSAEKLLVYFSSNPCVLHPILSILKPGNLKDILVQGFPGDTRVLRVEECVNLPVWQQAEKLEVHFLKVDCRLTHVQHFKNSKYDVSHLAVNVVRSLVENYFARNQDVVEIHFVSSESDQILEYLKQFEVRNDSPELFECTLAPNVSAVFSGSPFLFLILTRE